MEQYTSFSQLIKDLHKIEFQDKKYYIYNNNRAANLYLKCRANDVKYLVTKNENLTYASVLDELLELWKLYKKGVKKTLWDAYNGSPFHPLPRQDVVDIFFNFICNLHRKYESIDNISCFDSNILHGKKMLTI